VGLALGGRKAVPILEDATTIGPANRDSTYSVAVLEVQYQSLNPQNVAPAALPALEDRRTRRLEGPREEIESAEAKEAA
jgi:hypothetical protein